jgi:hypothetical protein
MSIFTKISTWWKNRGKNENEPEVYLGVTPEEYKKESENTSSTKAMVSQYQSRRLRPQRIVINNTNYRTTQVVNNDSSLSDAVLMYAVLSDNNTDNSRSDYSESTYSSGGSSSDSSSSWSSCDSSSSYSSCDCGGGGD